MPRKNSTRYSMIFTPDLLSKMNAIVNQSHSKSFAAMLEMLLFTAMKYNFDENCRYIPCVEISPKISCALPKPNSPDYKKCRNISFYFGNKLIKPIKKISSSMSLSMADTIRMLLSIAFQCDFTENFKFQVPTPINSLPKEDNNEKIKVFFS